MSDYQSGFQNPQEDPSSSQRLIIAFALIFVIIIGSQWLLSKYGPKQPEQKPAQQQSAQAATTTSSTAANTTPSAVAQAPAATATNEAKHAAAESETVVENALYRITFTNKGAAVTHWVLKNQTDDKGHPLDLVHPQSTSIGLPLSLHTYDTGLNDKLKNALYVANLTGSSPNTAQQPDKTGRTQAAQLKQSQSGESSGQTLTFEYADADTRVTKTFRFDDTYVIHADVSVTQRGAATTALFAWPAGFGDQTTAASYSHSNIAYDNGSSITREGTSKSFFGRGNLATNGASVQGPLAWAGPEDQYFTAVFLPDNPRTAQLVTFDNPIPQDDKNPGNGKTYPLLGAAVGNTNGSTSLRIFVGPKLLRVLSSIHAADPNSSGAANYTGPTLDNMLDFGFFGIVAKPLFIWLRWTYEHVVPNWGWAILVVTVIINLVLLPIRLKQIRSSMRMMRAQPQVDAINRKYQGVKFSDTERMQAKNAEIQELYKREGINPVGGCIPVLMQLPILWAFFKVLEITVELRHAPWLWVHDLSAPDPLHLLPLSLFVSMILLQSMTPTPGVDPVQAKMMKYTMPLMFGWFAWNFASGLSVYYTAGNVIAIIQQAVLNRTSLGREMREAMAKRAAAARGSRPQVVQGKKPKVKR